MSGSAIRAPLLLDARQLRAGEELRVELSPYRAQTYIGIRRWYRAEDGAYRPGKGVNIHAIHIPFLRAALAKAEAEALSSGLLDEESYQTAGLALPAEMGGP